MPISSIHISREKQKMANCLKNLAIKVVNLIVNEAHYHAASIASRSLPALERYQLSSFWKENGYKTTQKLAPLVFGLPEKEIDPPLLLEDCSYEIKDSSKKDQHILQPHNHKSCCPRRRYEW